MDSVIQPFIRMKSQEFERVGVEVEVFSWFHALIYILNNILKNTGSGVGRMALRGEHKRCAVVRTGVIIHIAKFLL